MPTTSKKPSKKPSPKRAPTYGGIGSAAVAKATGKSWDQWLAILDKDGAKDMAHPEIATLLSERHGVPPWWSQMVTVGYEQARGLRRKHETPDGFKVSGSKTINVPVGALFGAWNDAKSMRGWLPNADLEIRKATPSKSMRITWEASKGAGATSVSVNFYSKGEGKSQVTLEHCKLKSASQAVTWKHYWAQRLDELKSRLER